MQANDNENYSFESYSIAEWENFTPRLVESRSSSQVPKLERFLVIEATENRFALGLRYDGRIGNPHRSNKLRAVTIESGQTAVLVINGRHASYSGQHYSENWFNIALGEKLGDRVFLDLKPIEVYDIRENLF